MNCQAHQACIVQRAGYESRVADIARKYSLPVVSAADGADCRFVLDFAGDALKLFEPGQVRYRPVYMRSNSVQRTSRRVLLGRAIGRKVRTVVDASAGLGADTVLLAKMGYEVFAIERNPVIAALLEDGIQRLKTTTDQLSIDFLFADARFCLADLPFTPQVIYLDPMYPEGRKRSVQVARPLRVLRALCGDDTDSESLLKAALVHALKRVVVKRPHFAEPLCRDRLTHSMKGKLVRYDIYQIN